MVLDALHPHLLPQLGNSPNPRFKEGEGLPMQTQGTRDIPVPSMLKCD